MATNSMIPYANPAGNNQTTPGAGAPAAQPLALPGAQPGAGATGAASSTNPSIAMTPPATGTTGSASEIDDIFGAGVGGYVNSFLGSEGGTDSVILQDYVKSLQPQMATAQAQTNAALGAGGVSANSSVAGIADASLQAQETASIAQESAALTQSGEQAQEQLIQGMLGPAENWKNNQDMLPYELMGAGIKAVGSIVSA